MQVALVHGYYLSDSGSGVYVRELARALVSLGHDVTLVCQEREPERFDFIDSAFVMNDSNVQMRSVHRSTPRYAGRCRLVRPCITGHLCVYVHGPFPGFGAERVSTFHDASPEVRDGYIESNVTALRAVFRSWPPELVLAQHLIMQPFIVCEALGGSAPYVMTEHGSALNFSVRRNADLVPFAIEGLAGATSVVSVSDTARDDLVLWAAQHGLSIAEKTVALSPGVDYGRFVPGGDRDAEISRLRSKVQLPEGFDVDSHDDVIAFAGALRATKGIQHVVAALPTIAQRRGRRTRLLVAGAGPARPRLESLATLTVSGRAEDARALVAREPDLQSCEQCGDVVADAPAMHPVSGAAFLGHLDHSQLAAMFAASDIALVPSVFPEAAALVSIESLATGAVPLVAYHSGMAPLADYLARTLGDPVLASLTLGEHFTERLADAAVHTLERYPTRDSAFRRLAHELAASRYPSWERTAAEYIAMAAPLAVTTSADG